MKSNLTELSNRELIGQLEKLVAQEKETTSEIIRNLAEVEIRKLHLELGYSSLFDYVTKGLGYSESAALRRIKVARAGAKVPQIFNYLAEEKVSLSALDVSSGVLIKEDGVKVLEELKGKTREEAECVAASFSPVTPQSTKDKIKKIVISSPDPETDLFFQSEEFPTNSLRIRSGGKLEKFKISFSVGEEFMEKLKRAQDLMFEGNPDDLLLENFFGEALDLYVQKHCPKEKLKRREEREAKKEQQADTEISSTSKDNTRSQPLTRYIPSAMRDKVLQKDNYQCSYVSLNGTRCRCKTTLEVDHIKPFGIGGKTELDNLRVLCASHNLHAARKVFGAEFIAARIEHKKAAMKAG